jgi:hypothetical protein
LGGIDTLYPLIDTHYPDSMIIERVGPGGRGGPRSTKDARWTRDQRGEGKDTWTI